MSVWQQSCASSANVVANDQTAQCPYCRLSIAELEYVGPAHRQTDSFEADFRGSICRECGWWIIKLYRRIGRSEILHSRRDLISDGNIVPDFVHGWSWTNATLKELDLSNIATPIDEVRNFLVANYERRHVVHPRLMEETVGEVFRGLGWDVVVTAYSKDGGIDAVLSKDGMLSGVQVKRYKGTIGVEQIRAFTGAMVAKRLTTGIFVTTSRFSSAAEKFVEEIQPERKIELLDSSKLYDALRLTRRVQPKSLDEIFVDAHLQDILEEKPNAAELLKRHFRAEQGRTAVIHRFPD